MENTLHTVVHINLQSPYCVIILNLQMKVSNPRECISQYRRGFAVIINRSQKYHGL